MRNAHAGGRRCTGITVGLAVAAADGAKVHHADFWYWLTDTHIVDDLTRPFSKLTILAFAARKTGDSGAQSFSCIGICWIV